MFKSLYDTEATRYGVASVPLHKHNGADAPTIGDGSINNFAALPANNPAAPQSEGVTSQVPVPGVASLASLGLQVIDNPAESGFGNPANVWVMPLPIVHGFGTTTNLTLTANRVVGAVSGTLTGVFGGTSGTYTTRFSTGEQRNVNYTNGSAAITWTPGLSFATSSTAIVIVANARFKGGEAPLGSMLMFVNPDDGLRQIWFRADIDGEPVDRWYGMDFTVTAP